MTGILTKLNNVYSAVKEGLWTSSREIACYVANFTGGSSEEHCVLMQTVDQGGGGANRTATTVSCGAGLRAAGDAGLLVQPP